MKAISTITVLPETNEQQKDYVQSIKDSILSGDHDNVKIAVQMKRFEKIIKDVVKDKDVANVIYKEVEKYGEKTVNLHNAEITKGELGVKYNFTICKHPEWDRLNKEIEKLTDERKEVEKILKSNTKQWVYTDQDTGEIVNIYPPLRTSTTGIKIKTL